MLILFVFVFLGTPEITNSSITQTVKKDEQVTLSCSATGCPTAKVTWEKTEDATFSSNNETVTFAKVVPDNHGEYICKVSAKGKTVSLKGFLTVLCKYVKSENF